MAELWAMRRVSCGGGELAAPVEFHGGGERVGAYIAASGEAALGGQVGVVDEHEGGVGAEAAGLLDHGALVLIHKTRPEKFDQCGDEGDEVGDVPGGDDVDAAGGGRDGGDGGEGGEPAGCFVGV
jgi:hypothetical protein